MESYLNSEAFRFKSFFAVLEISPIKRGFEKNLAKNIPNSIFLCNKKYFEQMMNKITIN